MRIADRLNKLEAALCNTRNVDSFTYEERQVAAYELILALSASGRLHASQMEINAYVARIELQIRQQASRHATVRFRQHVAEWVTKMWEESGHKMPFLPPVIGSEYDDWRRPDLAARRIAIRQRSSIVALIGESDFEKGELHAPTHVVSCLTAMVANFGNRILPTGQ